MPGNRLRTLTLAVALLAAGGASAQSLDKLKSQAGGLLSSHGSGSSLPSLSSLGSAQNAAGVLGYCQKNGYLPSASSTLKDKLLGSLGGSQKASASSEYQQGLGGVLQGGDGQQFSLGDFKGKIAKQLCKTVADKAASSFLGG